MESEQRDIHATTYAHRQPHTHAHSSMPPARCCRQQVSQWRYSGNLLRIALPLEIKRSENNAKRSHSAIDNTNDHTQRQTTKIAFSRGDCKCTYRGWRVQQSTSASTGGLLHCAVGAGTQCQAMFYGSCIGALLKSHSESPANTVKAQQTHSKPSKHSEHRVTARQRA